MSIASGLGDAPMPYFNQIFETRFSRYFLEGGDKEFAPRDCRDFIGAIAILIQGREELHDFQTQFIALVPRLRLQRFHEDRDLLESPTKEQADRFYQIFNTYRSRWFE